MEQATYEFILNKPRWMRAKASILAEQIATLQSCLLPSAIRYDLDKVQSSPDDQTSAIFAKIDELERERKALVDGLADHYDEMRETFIKALTHSEYYECLCLRYISDFTQEETAEKMHTTDRNVRRYQAIGIKELERYFQKLS